MTAHNHRLLLVAGILLGAGMGGFFDGILLHQILQWHNMLSSKYPPQSVVNLEVNMFWDGLFHAFTWTVTALGIAVLWRAARLDGVHLATRFLLGSMAIGWGLFNLIEGLINHQLLGIHHVRHGPNEFVWDLGFLAFGAALLAVGIVLTRSPHR